MQGVQLASSCSHHGFSSEALRVQPSDAVALQPAQLYRRDTVHATVSCIWRAPECTWHDAAS